MGFFRQWCLDYDVHCRRLRYKDNACLVIQYKKKQVSGNDNEQM